MPKESAAGFLRCGIVLRDDAWQRANRVTGVGFRVDAAVNPVGAWSPQASAVRNALHAQRVMANESTHLNDVVERDVARAIA